MASRAKAAFPSLALFRSRLGRLFSKHAARFLLERQASRRRSRSVSVADQMSALGPRANPAVGTPRLVHWASRAIDKQLIGRCESFPFDGLLHSTKLL